MKACRVSLKEAGFLAGWGTVLTLLCRHEPSRTDSLSLFHARR